MSRVTFLDVRSGVEWSVVSRNGNKMLTRNLLDLLNMVWGYDFTQTQGLTRKLVIVIVNSEFLFLTVLSCTEHFVCSLVKSKLKVSVLEQ